MPCEISFLFRKIYICVYIYIYDYSMHAVGNTCNYVLEIRTVRIAVLHHHWPQCKQTAPLGCLPYSSGACTNPASPSKAASMALLKHVQPALTVPSSFSYPISAQDGCTHLAAELQRSLCQSGAESIVGFALLRVFWDTANNHWCVWAWYLLY